MELTFLGTGSAYPSPTRGASSLILRQESGECWMFDCGEGTQIQLMKSKVKPGKINKIFITHLHGDHMFGLPGLLCTLSMNCSRTEAVDIYGPFGLRKFVRTCLLLSRSLMDFSFRVHEIMPGEKCRNDVQEEWPVDHGAGEDRHPSELEGQNIHCNQDGIWTLYHDRTVTVTSSRLDHMIPTYGFTIEECESPGSLDVEWLKSRGIKPGPDYGKLKEGQIITSPDGQIVHPSDVIGPSRRGRKVVILGDTRDSTDMTSSAHDCDVLVHEATLENEKEGDAVERGHSTPEMAAAFAESVKAKLLILNHFSQRYKPEDQDDENSVTKLLEQAKRRFCGRVIAANDMMSVPIPRT